MSASLELQAVSPVDGKDLTAVVERLNQFLKRTGISQAKFAAMSGYSGSAISAFRAGTYRSESPAIAEAIVATLNRESARTSSIQPLSGGFVETSVAARILPLLERCHRDHTMGLITGEAGLGKTRAIDYYVSTASRVVKVHALEIASSPLYFMRIIARALGGMSVRGNLEETQWAVLDTLRGSDQMLIIDEAQRLSKRTLEFVRDIHDAAKVPVVLAGNAKVQDLVYGNGDEASSQFFSRLSAHLSLKVTTNTAADVEALAGQYLAPGDLESRAYLLELAHKRGGLRSALTTLTLAIEHPNPKRAAFVAVLRHCHSMRFVKV